MRNCAVYIPESRITAEQLVETGVIDDREQEQLRSIGVSDAPEDAQRVVWPLVTGAADRLFDRLGSSETHNIRYVALTYLSYLHPYSFDLLTPLRRRYGLTRSFAFSVRDQLCTNWLMTMAVCRDLLQDGSAGSSPRRAESGQCSAAGEEGKATGLAPQDGPDGTRGTNVSALLLTAEKCFLPDQRYGGGAFITGDAAAALLLSRKPGGDRLLTVRCSVDMRTVQTGKERAASDGIADLAYLLQLGKMLLAALQEAGLSLADIGWFIPNNTSPNLWREFARLMKIPAKSLYLDGIACFGHTNNGDLPLNYYSITERRVMDAGDYFVLMSLGNGGVVGCAVGQKGQPVPELPGRAPGV